jgi:hypothetical protein
MDYQETPPASSPLDNFFNIAFDAALRAQVKQAAVWAKVCTLCAFIGYGIALVVAIFGQPDAGYVRAGSIAVVLITILIGGCINYFLYRFAVATARGMDTMDSIKTNEGFDNLRIYFKVTGILLIIGLSLGTLIVLFAIGMGH